jgi:hypothetical protein
MRHQLSQRLAALIFNCDLFGITPAMKITGNTSAAAGVVSAFSWSMRWSAITVLLQAPGCPRQRCLVPVYHPQVKQQVSPSGGLNPKLDFACCYKCKSAFNYIASRASDGCISHHTLDFVPH